MEDQNRTSRNDEETEPVSSEIPPQVEAAQHERKATQYLHQIKRRLPSWDWNTSIQFGILVIGVVYAAVTYGLWSTANQSMYSGQRAYVLIVSSALDKPLQPNQPVVIRVEAKNTGLTPALNVRVRSTPGIDVAPPEHALDSADKPLIDIDLGAGQSVSSSTTMRALLTQARYDALVAKQVRLFLVVSIAYEDTFTTSPPNLTETCLVYNIDVRAFDACGSTIR